MEDGGLQADDLDLVDGLVDDLVDGLEDDLADDLEPHVGGGVRCSRQERVGVFEAASVASRVAVRESPDAVEHLPELADEILGFLK